MGVFSYYLSYYIFMLPGILIAMWASFKVNSTFNKFSRVGNTRGLTGAEAAAAVLRANGVSGVRIERVSGSLTDHYDPRTNVIRLSDPVYSSQSVAAIGVAAHEAGHAVQYAKKYAPIKLRTAIVPICNIGSQLSIPLIVIGSLLVLDFLVSLGIALFSLSVVFQLITLPVEFNASRRAMEAINGSAILTENEAKGARKVLTAAAMTYVAALLQALLSLLYYIIRFGNNRRNKDE